MRRCLFPAITVAVLFCSLGLAADETVDRKTPGVYVILDGSGSMWGQLPDGTHKITAAKEVLKGFSADDYAGRELAFRVYGHRRKGDCSDSELVVPFSSPEHAIGQMATFAEGVNPKGKTPISRSLRAAMEDFGDRPGEVILVSDGIETCDEDPCALVRDWRAQNVQIRVHVVGLGLVDKERAAMQCISDAAGTEYRDASSADELAAGLKEIQATAKASDALQFEWQVLTIKATNSAGERMRVAGTARREDGEPIEVSNNGHNRVPPGEVEVTVGVRTWNGNIYQPVTQKVTVARSGSTKLEVVVPEPPSVKARFMERGEERKGTYVQGYQGDQEVVSFRAKDRAYIDPGTYEFRSQPNAENHLSVSETFADGDHKEIVFELVHTVRAKLTMVAAGTDFEFRSHFELWQDGELAYKVHRNNGAQVLPGVYDARLPLKLTPYVHKGLVITEEDRQDIRIEVPVGHVTFRYVDANGAAMESKRCFPSRLNEDGKWVQDKIARTEQRIPLVPGEYRVGGWSHIGTFDPVTFTMAVGEDKEIVLRDKGGE